MTKDQVESLETRLSRSRTEIQSLRQNLALVKKENAELKKRLKKSSLIYEYAPAGVCIFQQGKLIDINQTALAMLEYSPAEIVGHEFTDFIHPDHRAPMKERLQNWLARKKTPDMFETCLLTKSNDALYCDLRVNKIKLNSRTTLIVLIANSEERKKREKEVVSSRKNMAFITLSSGIAGRLSQCLPPLAAGLDILRELPETGETPVKESLRNIEAASGTVQKIIQQLNRLNSRPYPPGKLSPLAINDLVQAAVSAVKSRLAFSNSPDAGEIFFKTFYRSTSLALLNPDEIREALINLIMNACEATTDGGDVLITTEGYDGLVHIYIQDNGIGMPEEIIERIFDPFYTSRGQHSGLGLSIAYSIIKRHNGSIEVSSRPDQGTTFHVRLPLAENPSPLPDRNRKNKKLADNRLLVIHSNPVIRQLISQLFADKGCRIMRAETAREGVSYINKMRFDLLITDMPTPGRHLHVLIGRYKKRNAASPVALVLPQEKDKGQGSLPEGEVDLCINQPIDLNRLLKDISALLKNRRPGRK